MLRSITLEVIGDQRLTCESCEERVERLLNALPGVEQVRARARTQRIEVLFDASVQEATAVAERLEKAGYETRVCSSPPRDATPAETRPRRVT
jgi:copper chaperone